MFGILDASRVPLLQPLQHLLGAKFGSADFVVLLHREWRALRRAAVGMREANG